jgi:hypothetical protein
MPDQPDAMPFIVAAEWLLLVMRKNTLPAPMSISWRTYPTPALDVQVLAEEFVAWVTVLDQITHDVVVTPDHGTHAHAEGHLRANPNVRVHVVTVTDAPAEVPA